MSILPSGPFVFQGDGAWPEPHQADGDLALVGEPLATVLAQADAWHQKQQAAEYAAEFIDLLRSSLERHAELQAMIEKLELEDETKAAATEAKYKMHRLRFRQFVDATRQRDGMCLSALPAAPVLVAHFLLEDLNAGKTYSVIKQAASAIRAAHLDNNLPDPCASLEVRAVIRLARHRRRAEQQQEAGDGEASRSDVTQ